MRKSVFKKHIDNLDEEQLREELMLLYEKYEAVKTHYKMDLGSDNDRKRVYDNAKKDIASKFKTKSYRRPRRPRIKAINVILKRLAKNAVFPHDLIDVYLFTTESAIHFMKEYDFHSEPLNNVILNSYNKACLGIKDSMLQEDFKERCRKIILTLNYYFGLRMTLRRLFIEVYPEEKKNT